MIFIGFHDSYPFFMNFTNSARVLCMTAIDQQNNLWRMRPDQLKKYVVGLSITQLESKRDQFEEPKTEKLIFSVKRVFVGNLHFQSLMYV